MTTEHKPRCLFTGARGEHQHHISGRDENGEYYDRALTAWLTRCRHVAVHTALRALGLDDVTGELSGVVLRLLRIGVFLVLLADAYQPDDEIRVPARDLCELGRALQAIAREIER